MIGNICQLKFVEIHLETAHQPIIFLIISKTPRKTSKGISLFSITICISHGNTRDWHEIEHRD